jgi:hypothetical protein
MLTTMAVVLRFGALYAAIVFAFGLVLEALRGSFLSPIAGELVAVLIELPIMLALCWLVASRIFPGRGLQPGQGIEIGLTAFLLLQVAGSVLFGALGPYSFTDNILFYMGDLSPARVVVMISHVLIVAMPFVHIVRSRSNVR